MRNAAKHFPGLMPTGTYATKGEMLNLYVRHHEQEGSMANAGEGGAGLGGRRPMLTWLSAAASNAGSGTDEGLPEKVKFVAGVAKAIKGSTRHSYPMFPGWLCSCWPPSPRRAWNQRRGAAPSLILRSRSLNGKIWFVARIGLSLATTRFNLGGREEAPVYVCYRYARLWRETYPPSFSILTIKLVVPATYEWDWATLRLL